MKQKQIFLFGGASDGLRILVDEGTKQAIVKDENYHIVHEYNLAFPEEVALKGKKTFKYVLHELLETYSQTRTGDDMKTAKAALKRRVSEMKTFLPPIGFFFITAFYFFIFEEVNKYFGAILIPGLIYSFAFRAGFVEIKNRIKRL